MAAITCYADGMSEDAEDFGPAMLALTEQQRKFVLAMLSDPLGNASKWARAAGYSDRKGAERVRGHRNMRSDAVLRAIQEEAVRHLNTFGPALAVGVMMKIARNPRSKHQLRAAEAIANRVGLHEKTEHRVTVEHVDDRRMLALAERLAAEIGVDPARLIGPNTTAAIEGEAREVAVEPAPDA